MPRALSLSGRRNLMAALYTAVLVLYTNPWVAATSYTTPSRFTNSGTTICIPASTNCSTIIVPTTSPGNYSTAFAQPSVDSLVGESHLPCSEDWDDLINWDLPNQPELEDWSGHSDWDFPFEEQNDDRNRGVLWSETPSLDLEWLSPPLDDSVSFMDVVSVELQAESMTECITSDPDTVANVSTTVSLHSGKVPKSSHRMVFNYSVWDDNTGYKPSPSSAATPGTQNGNFDDELLSQFGSRHISDAVDESARKEAEIANRLSEEYDDSGWSSKSSRYIWTRHLSSLGLAVAGILSLDSQEDEGEEQRKRKRVPSKYPSTAELFRGDMKSESQSTSQEQLAAEVKGIYAGLVMVEAQCIEVNEKQAAPERLTSSEPALQAKFDNKKWQALIALHRTRLHEHHDFFLTSQHPSASPALRRLAERYAMPSRMWHHGIHSFLELMRHRSQVSLEHMEQFLYLAYSMMALQYEAVPGFEDTWTPCLEQLGRYQMATEDDDMKAREVWTAVARRWYSRTSNGVVPEAPEGNDFELPTKAPTQPLAEDSAPCEISSAEYIDGEDKRQEPLSIIAQRKERILWLAERLARHAGSDINYDPSRETFRLSAQMEPPSSSAGAFEPTDPVTERIYHHLSILARSAEHVAEAPPFSHPMSPTGSDFPRFSNQGESDSRSRGTEPAMDFSQGERPPSMTSNSPNLESMKKKKATNTSSGNHTCSRCHKSYPRRCDLRKHEKYHTKPLTCPVDKCRQSFGRQRDLNRHLEGPHGIGQRLTPCPIQDCRKTLSRKDNLPRHLKRCHGVRNKCGVANGKIDG